jgi:hypothetical protein
MAVKVASRAIVDGVTAAPVATVDRSTAIAWRPPVLAV